MAFEDQNLQPPPAPRLSPREEIERKTLQVPYPGVQHWLNLVGNLKVVTTIPTKAPKKFSDGMLIYLDSVASPTTKRLYIYALEADAWYYVALT